jgi:TonB-linked SusC/RagA family outer membrane protein
MNRLLRSSWLIGMAATAVCSAVPAVAQAQAVIRGRVTTEGGQPVLAASVVISELGIGTNVDNTGGFTLTVPAARVSGQTATIRSRAIGFKPQTRTITVTNGTQTVDFALDRDPIMLEAVVTTGVSAATEQVKVPFSVTRVDSAMMPVQGASIANQIQGKVPGALVVSASGRPGAAPQIVLRGPVSLNATGRSQGPLYLVDGVPVQGNVPDLNPADIENVEVLKGAAAASLYGARAGSGVISITTKSGRTATAGLTFGLRTEIGAGDIEREFPLAERTNLRMDPTGQYFCSREVAGGSPCARLIAWDQEVQRVNNSGEAHSLPPQLFLYDFGISSAPSYDQLTGVFQATQWPEMRNPIQGVLTPSAYATTNFDVRGNMNRTGIFASFGNSVQQGAVAGLDGFRRNSVNARIDQGFGEKLNATVSTFYSQTKEDGANFDETGGGIWFNLTRAPWMSDVNAQDNLGRVVVRHNPLAQGDQNANPVYQVQYVRQIDRGNRFIGGTSLRYTPLDWVNLDANFGYDRSTGNTHLYRDRDFRTTASAPATASGYVYQGDNNSEQFTLSTMASATRTFFDDLNATFGTRYQFSDQTVRANTSDRDGLVLPGLVERAQAAAGANFTFGSSRQTIRDAGFAVTANLDYKDRYVLDLVGRRDGSSLFGERNRWQTFGRVGATWIASREPWWFVPEQVSLLKFFGSRGSTGQRPSFAAQYETFTIGTGGVLNPATLGNRDLKPEINTETEVGMDMELFSRFGVQVSYAHAVIDGQILPVRPSTTSGFANQWQNAGEITNKTWEATLTIPLIQRNDLNWTSRVIYDRTRSQITRLDVPEFVGTITPGPTNTFDIFKFREGEMIGTVYGFDMVKQCSQLPAGFREQCSMNVNDLNAGYRPNQDGYIVWLGAGNLPTEGITKNLWRARTGLGNGPWGNNTNWGMPITLRDSTNNIAFVALGSGLPKFHWGLSQSLDYKRLSVYGLLDSYMGQKIWNIANMWSLGDFQANEVDQVGKSVEEARPLGYYWRRGPSASPGGNAGVGGLYDALNPTEYSFEDASYVKLRELQVSYRVGRVAGAGDWKVGVIGRNLHTWTSFKGFDPEGGNTSGPLNSSALTPVTGYRFPNLRTVTLQLSSTF